jgi:hypothetical protein
MGVDRKHAQRIIDFQQLKRDIPLLAVVERYGLLGEFKRMGVQVYGPCPIHGGRNKKQFVINPNTSEWRCFGDCDRGGATLDFVAEMERTTIQHAAQLIASWFAPAGGNSINQRTQQRRSRKMSEGQRPSHKVFVVEDRAEGDERDAFWTRVGSAWPHKDGKGLNLQLATGVAVSGRVVLREYTEEDAEVDKKAKKAKR